VQIFRSAEAASEFLSSGSALTIGNFDGIHLGHQVMIRETVERAQAAGLKSALVTFDPHPQAILSPQSAPKLLTLTDEKLRLLQDATGLDAVIVIPFDSTLVQVSATEFLERVLLKSLSCLILVIGFNHAFGHNRQGDASYLRRLVPRLKFLLVTREPVMIDDAPVQSSRIRKAMTQGDYNEATRLLGHEFELCGKVVHGKGMGKRLGFPTINVRVAPSKIVPQAGVYAAYTLIGSEKRLGMMYIGESEQEFDFEVNLFDFDGDLYDAEVGVVPTAYIRPSQRFDSERELIAQIGHDEKKIRLMSNIL
jgi:riboflavin kinase/FMN adenylyltransferase